MTQLHEGATEGQQSLLAFFFSNPLVNKTGCERDPEEVSPLCFQEEIDIIKDNLSHSGRQIQFCSEPATVWNVRRRLNMGCKMLHFTGHGCSEYLTFEADGLSCGEVEPIHMAELEKLFKAGHQKPKLVFLGSCCSQKHGNALAKAGVPHVVAVNVLKDIADEAARNFSKAFYHALIAGNSTVKVAFDIAFSTVNTTAPDAAKHFVLLPKDGNHEVTMFDDLPKGAFVDETPPLPPAFGLPRARRIYFGAVELQKAVSLLQDPDAACTSFVGEAGIGKTERALQACHYVRERHYFDAIFYADCKQPYTDCRHHLPRLEGPMPDIERAYKQYYYRLIGSVLGMPQESNFCAETLLNFLDMAAIEKLDQRPFKIIVVLDIPDAFFSVGREARKGLVKMLDELCLEKSPFHLKVLLICKEQLLKGTDVFFGNTKEGVHEVGPLKREHSASLLLHLSPRDSGLTFGDVDAPQGTTLEKAMSLIADLPLMDVVDGHPGTLCLVGPELLDRPIRSPDVSKMARIYRARFKKVRSKSFLEKRASEVAFQAGLQDPRNRLVWVGATSRANAAGRDLGDDDEAYYRSAPWRHLSLALQHSLCDLQSTDGTEEHLVDDNPSKWNEGSGRSLSSESCFYNGASWGAFSQGRGHGYVSSFNLRVLNGDELSFIRRALRSCRRRKAGHRRKTRERGSDTEALAKAGGHTEAPGDEDKGKSEPNRHGDNLEDEVFSLETFVTFCQRWWGRVMATLSLIPKEWASVCPVKVHGFVARLEAQERLMKQGLPGVFLLRFSESHPGQFVLTFTCEASQAPGTEVPTSPPGSVHIAIQHSLVTVQPNRQWTLHYGKDNRLGLSYPSLRDLVNDKSILRMLYPKFAKEEAFETS